MWKLKALDQALAGGEEARQMDAAQWKRVAHVVECRNCQAAHFWAIGQAGAATIDHVIPEQFAAVCEAAEQTIKAFEDHRRRRAASVEHPEGLIATDRVEAPPAKVKLRRFSMQWFQIVFPAKAPRVYKRFVNWIARMLIRVIHFRRAIVASED